MKLDAGWKPILGVNNKDILSTDHRKVIMETTGITKTNLVKYLKDFKERGLILQNSLGGYEVNNLFMPKETGGIVEVTFTLDTE